MSAVTKAILNVIVYRTDISLYKLRKTIRSSICMPTHKDFYQTSEWMLLSVYDRECSAIKEL